MDEIHDNMIVASWKKINRKGGNLISDKRGVIKFRHAVFYTAVVKEV